MQRFLIWTGLALSAMAAGCQTQTTGTPTSNWRFPCNYRAFDAGFCDNLNGMPNTNYNLVDRIAGY